MERALPFTSLWLEVEGRNGKSTSRFVELVWERSGRKQQQNKNKNKAKNKAKKMLIYEIILSFNERKS